MAKRKRRRARKKRIQKPYFAGAAAPVLAAVVGQLLQQRLAQRLSQEHLEAKAGLPTRHLGRYERGERHPSGQMLGYWAEALGCYLVVVPGAPPGAPGPTPRPDGWRGEWKAQAGASGHNKSTLDRLDEAVNSSPHRT